MPGISGLQAIPKIKSELPDLNIVMLTVFSDNETLFNALRLGASGYLVKDFTPNELRQSILSLNKGGVPLSPQIAKKIIAFSILPNFFLVILKKQVL